MTRDHQHHVTLNNGISMPLLGLGVFKLEGTQAYQAVSWALALGYRLIDTASAYTNETQVGKAIADASVPRERIFVTTKVWNSEQGYPRAKQACEESLQRLGMDYVDCYLIHWPIKETRLETWKALEELYTEGKCRSIGVSNFTIRHLEELREVSSYVPVLNQVEFSPFLYQKELLDYCRSQGIRLQAYAPLTRGSRLDNEIVTSIARNYDRTPAQIMLRWALQHGVSVIPKSAHYERLEENTDVFSFDLTTRDMLMLDACNESYRTIPWNPETWD